MNQVLFGRQFDDAGASKAWLLAQVKPGMMARAQHNLENQGFPVFVPQVRETRRVGGRFKDRVGPLFPGYIFVQVDTGASPWRKINSTFGVSRLVAFAKDRPAVVPSALITDLRSRFSAGMGVPLEAELEAGDQVQLVRGPFAGFAAKVETVAANDRIWLLLDLLGREARVSTSRRNIIPA